MNNFMLATFSLLAGCLIGAAVPLPQPQHKAPAEFPVGTWIIRWGAAEQTTTFREDGTCESTCGKGYWWLDGCNVLHFSEREDTQFYVIKAVLWGSPGDLEGNVRQALLRRPRLAFFYAGEDAAKTGA